MQELQLCFLILHEQHYQSIIYVIVLHLHSQFVRSGFIFWFFIWFSENQIWFGTRREAKISLSSTRDTCFLLLVSTLYPQETSLGTWWSDSAPAYDQQPHSTSFFSYKDHGNLSTPIFSCVGIRLFSPPMQTKSSMLLPPHIAEVGCPYVGSCLSYTNGAC